MIGDNVSIQLHSELVFTLIDKGQEADHQEEEMVREGQRR